MAELRTLRRLARTTTFLALGIALVGTAFAYYSHLHATSVPSLNAGTSLPRFTTGYFNSYLLWFFMAALVFLGFDLRQRDARERIADAFYTRPLSNLSLVGGRLVAVVLTNLIPLFAVLLVVQAIGTIGRTLGWGFHPIEAVSTFTFFFLDALPALTLWCATVFLLAVVLQSRLATAIAALAMLGVHMWSVAQAPSFVLPALSLLYIHDNWASDLAPRLPDAPTLLHRSSMLLLAAAFVVWSAALYKRPDGRARSRRMILGSLLATAAAVGIGTVVAHCLDGIELRKSWLAAHQAVAGAPTPRLEHLNAEIRIDPGENLRLDLDLAVSAEVDLPRLLFSLNPGFEISELRLGRPTPDEPVRDPSTPFGLDPGDSAARGSEATDDRPTPFQHEQGLLVVELAKPLAAGSHSRLTIRASGIPDPDFAYLDSVVDWRTESSRNALLWLGTAGGIFDSRYVALTPGLRWLPRPGVNLDGAQRVNSPTVDLTVDVPDGWLVAGPGRRQQLGNGRYRYRPEAPVPEVGLFAAPFERRALTVSGVEFELLLHPAHLRNLDYYASTRELLRSRLEDVLDKAVDAGIPYPFGGFSLVEVPAHLRAYGGGEWLSRVTEMPGLLLFKEQGFPFANVWTNNEPARYAEFPGGFDAWKFQWLEYVFGSRARRALSRNLVTLQAIPDGRGARALEYVSEELGRLAFLDPRSRGGLPANFTAHSWNTDARFGATVVQMIESLSRSQDFGSGGFRPIFAAPPSAWERALDASLVDMDLARVPNTAIQAFALRATAVSQAIFDSLGRERTLPLLAHLRRNGGTFGADDFADALAAVDPGVEAFLGHWLTDVGLPGFIASRAEVRRVSDDHQGQPRYEVRLHVRNGEPTPGLLRLSKDLVGQGVDPVRVGGDSSVEIGMVMPEPPGELWLLPYLALNRDPIVVALDDIDAEEVAAREPFVGARPSTWRPPATAGVVIDDLDPGFSVEERHQNTQPGGSPADPVGRERDQGLPTWTLEPGEWSRASLPASWGKYRHTTAGSLAGDGASVAVFAAVLPSPGRWRLDYHLPTRYPFVQIPMATYGTLGSFDMTLVKDGRAIRIDFDGAAGEVGWNKIGEFDIAATEVRLEISSRTDGEMVIADAIRWVPLD